VSGTEVSGHDGGVVGAVRLYGLVALAATYASYRHGREFALRFGVDVTAAASCPSDRGQPVAMATMELRKGALVGERCSYHGRPYRQLHLAPPGAHAPHPYGPYQYPFGPLILSGRPNC
jgi:hypothetical protein